MDNSIFVKELHKVAELLVDKNSFINQFKMGSSWWMNWNIKPDIKKKYRIIASKSDKSFNVYQQDKIVLVYVPRTGQVFTDLELEELEA